MSVNVKVLLTVIWISFLSLVHSTSKTLISSQLEVIWKDCNFPPNEFRENVYSLCSLTEQDPHDALAVKFQFRNFVCMELLELSRQVCDPKLAPKLQKIEEVNKIDKVDEFCGKFDFSETRPENTTALANVSISNLANHDICVQFCVAGVNLNPLCEAIFLANQLLMGPNPGPPPAAETRHKEKPVIGEKIIKNQNTNDTHSNLNAIQKSNVDESFSIKQSNGSKSNETKTNDERNPQIYIAENNMEQNTTIAQLKDKIQAANTEQHKKQKEVNEPPAGILLSSVSSDYSTETESLAKGNANVPADEHEVKSDILSEDDSGDGETKGVNAEDRIPPIGQEENSGADDESPRNVASGINGQPYDKAYPDTFVDAQDSHFFAYFLTMVVICIVGYLVFHNKQKIIALALEGRRMQGSRRRPNTSSYKKLDSNLEEAVTSTCSSSSVTHVIF